MFYDFEITITAGATKTSPVKKTLTLTHGVINKVRVDFPPGPRGEVHLAINHGLHQLFPTNPDGDFRADNTYINYDDYFELLADPFELTALGWAPTADYDHTLHIQIGIIESVIALASLKVATGIEKFLNLVGIGV